MASPLEEPTTTTTIKATCHCKTINLTLNYPKSTLPLPRSLCLCKICRQVSGGPFGCSYVPLPSPFQPPNFNLDTKDLTSYKSSDDLTRYFCTKCGAHVFVYVVGNKTWEVATGILDKTEGIVKWEGCKYVEDTIDGGVSVWFKEIADSSAEGGKRELKSWVGSDTEGFNPQKQQLQLQQQTKVETGEEERLHAQCHCGGVKFYITRPNEDSKKTEASFPDLMVPFHESAFAGNPENIPWYLRENDTKYLAGTCTCESCRLILGFEVQSWAFIPKCNVFQEDGKPIDFQMGMLKRYVSSEGVWRNFCQRCGATCFWNSEWREDVVDVSTGLFIPPQGQGSRVEAWLDWWTERISFKEEAVSTSLVTSLAEGLKEWGLDRESKFNS